MGSIISRISGNNGEFSAGNSANSNLAARALENLSGGKLSQSSPKEDGFLTSLLENIDREIGQMRPLRSQKTFVKSMESFKKSIGKLAQSNSRFHRRGVENALAKLIDKMQDSFAGFGSQGVDSSRSIIADLEKLSQSRGIFAQSFSDALGTLNSNATDSAFSSGVSGNLYSDGGKSADFGNPVIATNGDLEAMACDAEEQFDAARAKLHEQNGFLDESAARMQSVFDRMGQMAGLNDPSVDAEMERMQAEIDQHRSRTPLPSSDGTGGRFPIFSGAWKTPAISSQNSMTPAVALDRMRAATPSRQGNAVPAAISAPKPSPISPALAAANAHRKRLEDQTKANFNALLNVRKNSIQTVSRAILLARRAGASLEELRPKMETLRNLQKECNQFCVNHKLPPAYPEIGVK